MSFSDSPNAAAKDKGNQNGRANVEVIHPSGSGSGGAKEDGGSSSFVHRSVEEALRADPGRTGENCSAQASSGLEGLRDSSSNLRRAEGLTSHTAAEAEAICLTQPQVGCQVIHRFGPGVYIRECLIPAGAFVIGHHHRFAHVNIHLAGAISMRDGDGEIYVSRAPRFYIGQPGRKTGLALEDVVWQNIFATAVIDVEALERQLFDKSQPFLDLAARVQAESEAARQADREDFFAVLDEYGFTPYQARALSENAADQIPMPVEEWSSVVIRKSAIEGRGVFVQVPAQAGDILGPARIGSKRTPAGRYANHSLTPNAVFVAQGRDVYLMATEEIAPFCSETVPGDEVTVDYRQALGLAGRLI